MVNAFVAKAVLGLDTTTGLIERLSVDRTLRRICGFPVCKKVPSESTFSRAFAEFADSRLPERVHESLIKAHLSDELIGHLSRDGTAIPARERPARSKATKTTPPAKKRGRPARGEARPAAKDSPLERQRQQTLPEMLAEIPTHCDRGTKCNAQGYKVTDSHRFVLDELMRHVEEIEARIARFDARLLAELRDEQNTLALLQTLPGVDLIGAAMLLVEIGADMAAFGSADRLASRVGICPGNNASAGKRKSGRVRKGNLYVLRFLCELAHAASRTQSAFKAKFQSLIVRRGHKRSIVALAHKILRTIFCMLQRNELFRDFSRDYEALSVQRNAPRWIKALTRFGFIPAAA